MNIEQFNLHKGGYNMSLDKFKNKKVLVTGGAGFVGSNLTNKLVKLGAKVTVLDDLFTGDLENIDSLEDIHFVNGSVTNTDLVGQLVKQANLVFHLAARNIIVSTKDPYSDLQTNVFGPNFLNSAFNSQPIYKHIVIR